MMKFFNHTDSSPLPSRWVKMGALLTLLLTFLVGCGSDDSVMEYDRDFTQVTYRLRPGYDLQYLYTVTVTYTDLKGVEHTENLENTTLWEYKEKESGFHPISLRATARAKSPESYNLSAKDVYALTWEYSIHWYQQESGAKSIQPASQGQSVKRDDIETYMQENPVITLISFSKP